MLLSWMIYSVLLKWVVESRKLEKSGLVENLKELNLTEDC